MSPRPACSPRRNRVAFEGALAEMAPDEARLPLLVRNAADARDAGRFGQAAAALADAAETAHRLGNRQQALDLLAELEEVSTTHDGRWADRIAAVGLADPAVDGDLDALDEAVIRLARGRQDRDFEGTLARGYHHRLEKMLSAGAGFEGLLRLQERLEGVRWFGRGDAARSPRGTRLLVAGAGGRGAMLLVPGATPRLLLGGDAIAVLDRASMEGQRWVTAGEAPPAASNLALLTAILDGLDPGEPLLLHGTGLSARVPISLIPERGADANGMPAGLVRPTARLLAGHADAQPTPLDRGLLVRAIPRPDSNPPFGFDELARRLPPDRWRVIEAASPADIAAALQGESIVHVAGHGVLLATGSAAIELAPGQTLRAEDVASWRIAPGAVVVFAACEGAGGEAGDIPMDLPMGAMRAGAGAVLWSRYPVRSRPLHEALGTFYSRIRDCKEVLRAWHGVRGAPGPDPSTIGRDSGPASLLGMELGIVAACAAD